MSGVRTRTPRAGYTKRLRARIVAVLSQRPLNFCDLIRECEGAFPVEVNRQLAYLKSRRQVTAAAGYFRVPGKTRPVRHDPGPQRTVGESADAPANLAAPHPLDFDWRFTPDTRAKIAAFIEARVPGEGRVGLLGAPSILGRVATVRPSTVLIDRNKKTVEVVLRSGIGTRALVHDLFEPFPHEASDALRGGFDFVLADPPWYLEFYKAFSIRGAEMLKPEGVLALSILPALTRPTAVIDRRAILRFLESIGLELAEEHEGFFRYELPPFERAALLENGIDCQGPWRSSELWLFRKVREIPAQAIKVAKPDDDNRWESFWLDKYEIRLRVREEKNGGDRLFVRPINTRGGTFRTVSRRARKRPLIDLWTSDNLAYSVTGLSTVRFALTQLAATQDRNATMRAVRERFRLTKRQQSQMDGLLEELFAHGKK
jgi:hypothetical protein